MEPTSQFNYDEVERAIDGQPAADPSAEMATTALSGLMSWQVSRAILGKKHVCVQTVGLRTVAALWVIRPDLFGGCSLSELASRIKSRGVTDTILSRYATEFRDQFNFKGRGQRPDETRARMRAAQRPTKIKNDQSK